MKVSDKTAAQIELLMAQSQAADHSLRVFILGTALAMGIDPDGMSYDVEARAFVPKPRVNGLGRRMASERPTDPDLTPLDSPET